MTSRSISLPQAADVPMCHTQVMDDEFVSVDLDELAGHGVPRVLFQQVGVAIGADASRIDAAIDAATTTTLPSTATTATTTAASASAASAAASDAHGDAPAAPASKRARKSVVRLDPAVAERGGGQLRAVSVDAPERGLEGDWWLCEILGPASQATAQQAHATDLFEEGWWIVRIKWYRHVPGSSPRKYTLLQNSTRWLSVSAIIRVDGLEFEGGQRVARSREQLLSDDRASLIGECQ